MREIFDFSVKKWESSTEVNVSCEYVSYLFHKFILIALSFTETN